MLGWALTFLVVALIAAVFGFGGIASPVPVLHLRGVVRDRDDRARR